jgi:hypothetical protein
MLWKEVAVAVAVACWKLVRSCALEREIEIFVWDYFGKALQENCGLAS